MGFLYQRTSEVQYRMSSGMESRSDQLNKPWSKTQVAPIRVSQGYTKGMNWPTLTLTLKMSQLLAFSFPFPFLSGISAFSDYPVELVLSLFSTSFALKRHLGTHFHFQPFHHSLHQSSLSASGPASTRGAPCFDQRRHTLNLSLSFFSHFVRIPRNDVLFSFDSLRTIT